MQVGEQRELTWEVFPREEKTLEAVGFGIGNMQEYKRAQY